MIQQLSRFRSQRKEADLVTLAAHADLRFRQQQIVAIQIQDFLGPESLQQHQSHDGQISRGAETGPESRHFIHRQWGYGAFGGLHAQPTQGKPWPADAHRCTLPVSLLKPRSNLPRSIREYDAQGTINNSNALVDGAAGQLALLTRLESHIVQQRRFGECIFSDRVGVMNTLPPTEKVQQLVRITFQGIIRQAAKGLVIEILIDPVNLASCRLHDDAIRASCLIGGGLVKNTKRHGRAASSRNWNWRASPFSVKKLFGSWPSGNETLRTSMPCSLSRQASDCDACCPLPFVSASKAR